MSEIPEGLRLILHSIEMGIITVLSRKYPNANIEIKEIAGGLNEDFEWEISALVLIDGEEKVIHIVFPTIASQIKKELERDFQYSNYMWV